MRVSNKGAPKKIVQFVHDLSSGGAETMVKDYAIELRVRGHDVQILVLNSEPEMPNEQMVRTVEIPIVELWHKETPAKNLVEKAVRKLYREILIKKRIYEYMKKEKPDVVHIHLSLMYYLKTCKKLLRHSSVFYTCHSEVKYIFDTDFNSQRNKRVLKQYLRNGNTKMIALHQKMADELGALFCVDNVLILNNPVDINRFQYISVNKIEFRKQLGIPRDSFVIGHVGRFSEPKNHKFLVEVFKSAFCINANVFLLLIGAGELMEQTRQLLDGYGLQQHYLILSDRSDIPQLEAIMDAFCFPSIYEGLSIALLEAQAARLKCIISNNISSETIVTNHVYKLSLVDSVDNWARTLLYNCTEAEKPQKRLIDYDVNNVVNQLEDIYFESGNKNC